MVAWNSTEAEFHEERGEIVLISRYRLQDDNLKLKTGAQLAKCVGAVSILFVQSDLEESRSQTKSSMTLMNDDPDKVTVSLPASLSVVPVPCPSFITPLTELQKSTDTPNKPVIPSEVAMSGGKSTSDHGFHDTEQVTTEIRDTQDEDRDHEEDIEETWSNEDTMYYDSGTADTSSKRKIASYAHDQHLKKSTKKSSYANLEIPGLASSLKQKLGSINIPQTSVNMDQEIEIGGSFKGKKTLFSRKNKGPNKCKYCRKIVNSWESIVEHALEDHGMISGDTDEVACPICKGLFSKRNMSAFIQHVQLHDKNWQHMCQENPTMYMENSSELSVVQNQDSENEDFDSDQLNSDMFEDTGDGQSDSEQQDTAKKKKGGNRSFPRLNARITSEVLKCMECASQVSSYSDILHHCKLHDMFKQCPVCGKQFTLRGGLLRHFITHIDNRVFTCPSCDAYFTRKDNLKRHMEKKCSGVLGIEGPGVSGILDRPNQQNKRFKSNPKEKLILKIGKRWSSKPSSTGLSTATSSQSTSDFGTPDTSNDNFSEQDLAEMEETEVKVEPQNEDDIHQNEETYTAVMEKGQNVDSLSNKDATSSNENLANMRDDRPVLSYKCATCDINFESVQELKRHVVLTHTEETPSTSNAHTTYSQGYSQADEQEDIKPFSYSDNNHYTSNLDYRFQEGQQPSHASFSHKSMQQEELQAMDVIDIEALGKYTDMDEDSNEKNVSTESTMTGKENKMTNLQNLLSDKDSRISAQVSDSVGEEEGMDDLVDYTLEDSSDSNILGVDSPGPINSSESYTERTSDFLKTSFGSVIKGRKGAVNKTAPICHFCGIVFDKAVDILHHGEVHELELTSQSTCTICLKELSGKDSLLRHANSHIGRWYPCNICSASFSRKDNLKRHMKKHEESGGLALSVMGSG